MPNDLLADVQFKASSGAQVTVDKAEGIVECFVAGIGNKDSVGDIVLPGAFTESLKRRKPRVVWGHSWNDPIGKVLEIYEVPNSDSRLPPKMKSAGIGGLFAKVQFNLGAEKGREAFANVAFFGEEQEWSIGYKTLQASFDPIKQANMLKEVELYEVSPVLHGANQLTGTISVKDGEYGACGVNGCDCGTKTMETEPKAAEEAVVFEKGFMMGRMPMLMIPLPMPNKPEGSSNGGSEGDIWARGEAGPIDMEARIALAKEIHGRTKVPIKIVEASENMVVFLRKMVDQTTRMYRMPYHKTDDGKYTFGKPARVKPQTMYSPISTPGPPNPLGHIHRKPNPNPILGKDPDTKALDPTVVESNLPILIPCGVEQLFEAKAFLEPVLDYYDVDATPTGEGLLLTYSNPDFRDAAETAIKALGGKLGRGGGLGKARRAGRALQLFDPDAWDGDNDGLVQEGTPFERPSIPGINTNLPGQRHTRRKPRGMPKDNRTPGPSRDGDTSTRRLTPEERADHERRFGPITGTNIPPEPPPPPPETTHVTPPPPPPPPRPETTHVTPPPPPPPVPQRDLLPPPPGGVPRPSTPRERPERKPQLVLPHAGTSIPSMTPEQRRQQLDAMDIEIPAARAKADQMREQATQAHDARTYFRGQGADGKPRNRHRPGSPEAEERPAPPSPASSHTVLNAYKVREEKWLDERIDAADSGRHFWDQTAYQWSAQQGALREYDERGEVAPSGMRSRGNDPWDEGPSPAEERGFEALMDRVDNTPIGELYDMDGLSNRSNRLLDELITEHGWDVEEGGIDVDKTLDELLPDRGKIGDSRSKFLGEVEDDFWDDPSKFMDVDYGPDPYDVWKDRQMDDDARGGMRSETKPEPVVDQAKISSLNSQIDKLRTGKLDPLLKKLRKAEGDGNDKEARRIRAEMAPLQNEEGRMREQLGEAMGKGRALMGMRSMKEWRNPKKAEEMRDLKVRMNTDESLGDDINSAVQDAIDIFDGRLPQYGNDAAYFRETATDFRIRDNHYDADGFSEISDEDLNAAADLLDQAADAIEKHPIDVDATFEEMTGESGPATPEPLRRPGGIRFSSQRDERQRAVGEYFSGIATEDLEREIDFIRSLQTHPNNRVAEDMAAMEEIYGDYRRMYRRHARVMEELELRDMDILFADKPESPEPPGRGRHGFHRGPPGGQRSSMRSQRYDISPGDDNKWRVIDTANRNATRPEVYETRELALQAAINLDRPRGRGMRSFTNEYPEGHEKAKVTSHAIFSKPEADYGTNPDGTPVPRNPKRREDEFTVEHLGGDFEGLSRVTHHTQNRSDLPDSAQASGQGLGAWEMSVASERLVPTDSVIFDQDRGILSYGGAGRDASTWDVYGKRQDNRPFKHQIGAVMSEGGGGAEERSRNFNRGLARNTEQRYQETGQSLPKGWVPSGMRSMGSEQRRDRIDDISPKLEALNQELTATMSRPDADASRIDEMLRIEGRLRSERHQLRQAHQLHSLESGKRSRVTAKKPLEMNLSEDEIGSLRSDLRSMIAATKDKDVKGALANYDSLLANAKNGKVKIPVKNYDDIMKNWEKVSPGDVKNRKIHPKTGRDILEFAALDKDSKFTSPGSKKGGTNAYSGFRASRINNGAPPEITPRMQRDMLNGMSPNPDPRKVRQMRSDGTFEDVIPDPNFNFDPGGNHNSMIHAMSEDRQGSPKQWAMLESHHGGMRSRGQGGIESGDDRMSFGGGPARYQNAVKPTVRPAAEQSKKPQRGRPVGFEVEEAKFKGKKFADMKPDGWDDMSTQDKWDLLYSELAPKRSGMREVDWDRISAELGKKLDMEERRDARKRGEFPSLAERRARRNINPPPRIEKRRKPDRDPSARSTPQEALKERKKTLNRLDKTIARQYNDSSDALTDGDVGPEHADFWADMADVITAEEDLTFSQLEAMEGLLDGYVAGGNQSEEMSASETAAHRTAKQMQIEVEELLEVYRGDPHITQGDTAAKRGISGADPDIDPTERGDAQSIFEGGGMRSIRRNQDAFKTNAVQEYVSARRRQGGMRSVDAPSKEERIDDLRNLWRNARSGGDPKEMRRLETEMEKLGAGPTRGAMARPPGGGTRSESRGAAYEPIKEQALGNIAEGLRGAFDAAEQREAAKKKPLPKRERPSIPMKPQGGGMRSEQGGRTEVRHEATFFKRVGDSLDKEIREAKKRDDGKTASALTMLQKIMTRQESGKTGAKRTNAGSITVSQDEVDQIMDGLMAVLDRQVDTGGSRTEMFSELLEMFAASAMATFISKTTEEITSRTTRRRNSRGQTIKVPN